MLGFYFVMTAYQACFRVLPAKDGKTDTFFAPDISEVWRGGQKRQSRTASDELHRRASEAAGARLGLIMRTTELCRTRGRKLDPTLIATMEAGRGYSATDLWEAQYARTDCFGKVQKILASFDLIASPTLSAPPLPVGLHPLARVTIAGQDWGTIRGAWYPYTFPFNMTGHPALSLPCGWTEERLPIGLQLVGRWHDDAFLLDLAERLEAAFEHVTSAVSSKEALSCGRRI